MKIDLKKPITTGSGEILNSLELDFESLSTADLKSAMRIKSMISDTNSVDASKIMAVMRLDNEFQIAAGFIAACKGTPGLSHPDFLKLSMIDAIQLGEAAYDYFFE